MPILGGEKCSKGICRKKNVRIFASELQDTVDVAQLVRASDCGSEGRGFEPHLPPQENQILNGKMVK